MLKNTVKNLIFSLENILFEGNLKIKISHMAPDDILEFGLHDRQDNNGKFMVDDTARVFIDGTWLEATEKGMPFSCSVTEIKEIFKSSISESRKNILNSLDRCEFYKLKNQSIQMKKSDFDALVEKAHKQEGMEKLREVSPVNRLAQIIV